MKKLLPLWLVALLLPILFSACDDDGYYYYDDYDQYIPGRWELIYADGVPVSGYKVNYLDFYASGAGVYYYYDHGVPYELDLRWSTSYDYYYNSSVLYINYADGSNVSMDYWFNSNATRLYTSWYSGPYRHEYVYRLVDDFVWPAPSRPQAPAADEGPQTLMPGK